MEIICQMLELPADSASILKENPARLPDVMKSARSRSDVYRYWHAIEYLLMQHAPDSPSARWLSLGSPLGSTTAATPPARLLLSGEVAALDQFLQGVEPEALVAYYDAGALDGAGVYPRTWQTWEETFDPLGQVLEHYSFLQYCARNCAKAGSALLLVFEEMAEGAV